MHRTATHLTALAVALVALGSANPTARQPRTLQPQDYGCWEQLVAQRTPLSPDGRWLVYGITRANRQNELRVQPTDGGAVTALPFGEQPAFSDDSKWLAYLIGFSEEQEAKLRKDKKPLHKQLGLLELATGKQLALNGVESFAFSPAGTHIAMRRYAPEPVGGAAPPAPAASDETIAPGTTLVVRELATGRDMTFGNVSEIAWPISRGLRKKANQIDYHHPFASGSTTIGRARPRGRGSPAASVPWIANAICSSESSMRSRGRRSRHRECQADNA